MQRWIALSEIIRNDAIVIRLHKRDISRANFKDAILSGTIPKGADLTDASTYARFWLWHGGGAKQRNKHALQSVAALRSSKQGTMPW